MAAGGGSVAARFLASGSSRPGAAPWFGWFSVSFGGAAEVFFPDGSVVACCDGSGWVACRLRDDARAAAVAAGSPVTDDARAVALARRLASGLRRPSRRRPRGWAA